MVINQIARCFVAVFWGMIVWLISGIVVFRPLLFKILTLEFSQVLMLTLLIISFGMWFFISAFVVGLRSSVGMGFYLGILLQFIINLLIFILPFNILDTQILSPTQVFLFNLGLLPFSALGGYLGNEIIRRMKNMTKKKGELQ